MFTALNIHLFHVEKLFVAFLRISQRAFWPTYIHTCNVDLAPNHRALCTVIHIFRNL